MSWPWVTKWIAGLGLSGPATVLIGISIETRRPDRTRPAAATTRSGVIRFIVPSWSSAPQRPQFLTDSKIRSNSSSVTRGWAGLDIAIVVVSLRRSWGLRRGAIGDALGRQVVLAATWPARRPARDARAAASASGSPRPAASIAWRIARAPAAAPIGWPWIAPPAPRAKSIPRSSNSRGAKPACRPPPGVGTVRRMRVERVGHHLRQAQVLRARVLERPVRAGVDDDVGAGEARAACPARGAS